MTRTSPAVGIGSGLALALVATGAAAHADPVAAPGWTVDPWIVVPLLAGAGLNLIGHLRLGARTVRWPPVLRWRAASAAAGWLALAVALVSPLHAAGERLFSFHMVEHEIVIVVAAPLLVLARPAGPMLWALPRGWRLALGRFAAAPASRTAWRLAAGPRAATLLHGAAIWFWHVPSLFDAALADVVLHRLQHLSFFATGLLFWWAVLVRPARGAGIWHLFLTSFHTGLLGALITLAPRVLYALQTSRAIDFGLTPLEDQQLAGLLMWVPPQFAYAAAALVLAARGLRRSGAAAPPAVVRAAR